MKVISELLVTDGKKIVLSIGEFRGVERIDLRQYIKVNDDYIATKRGINFCSEWLPDFIKMVNKLETV